MDNPYHAPAPLWAKALALTLVTLARVPGWVADWRLTLREEQDARHGRSRWAQALDRWDDAQMEAQTRMLGDDQ